MNTKLFTKTRLIIFLPILLIAGLIYIPGCDDSGVVEPPPAGTDTSVVIYKNVTAFYWFHGTNDTSYMGVNLLEGLNVRQLDTTKDMELIDNQNDTTNFYFRTGNLTKDAIGFQVRFNRPYHDLDSIGFDSLSVIPDSDTLLTPADFTQDDTYGGGAWSYFNLGMLEKPVYSFYLAGKFNYNQTGGYRVYGVFHVKSIETVYAPLYNSYGVKITIDIKLNKAGKNNFKP
jgi:hypothetical protein